ncbi:tripartite tricarboxylate transporter substrate binding protein [Candidimonas sp. SYP-B2681]|uniref:Bug family tripartite tricarboxylate transporter substrate binding protein n=1 Tax=Candidimonas sp. SYP-B2681 TaxID=2497686 RepID=UPI000F89CDA7|nr:tripartite tricarboxylate transporter substrate binding protein [Candidimonas sp. SYP-B2681]RTZ41553.1 tripartite tricarboxylate transporter substrate binding protein [Candidimonas sp. SYP-B2681]
MSTIVERVKKGMVASALSLVSGLVGAQAYPTQPIRFIVPYVPGGASDVAARLVTKDIKATTSLTAVIDNKPGAGAQIGTRFVAEAAPDGYTLGFFDNSFVINPALVGDKLPYDSTHGFKPVVELVKMPFILEVNKDVKANTLEEFVKLLKDNPGQFNYGSAGNGSPVHFAMEQFKHATKVDITHIAYKGGGPSLVGLVGGETQATMATVASSLQYMKNGRLKPLAVTGSKRLPELPEVPTFAELGYPEVDFSYSMGLFAPKDTPDSVIEWLSAAFNKELNREQTKAQLATAGFQVVGGLPQDYQAFIAAEIPRWKRFVNEVGVKIE